MRASLMKIEPYIMNHFPPDKCLYRTLPSSYDDHLVYLLSINAILGFSSQVKTNVLFSHVLIFVNALDIARK